MSDEPSADCAIVGEALGDSKPFVPPLPLRLLLATPFLRDIPALVLAFGRRPYRLERPGEHAPA